jgi:hypothetical protein
MIINDITNDSISESVVRAMNEDVHGWMMDGWSAKGEIEIERPS